MSIIAIITARGGSKRIPKKNIKEFMGKPMIAYAIQAAKDAKIFDEIMVSTDDDEIAEIAKKYGASVPFMRSSKTADDFATTYDVLEEVITEYQKRDKIFDELACIYPCVPFLNGETLRNAYKVFSQSDCDTLIPVTRYSFPIQRALKINSNNYLEYREPAYACIRSQDIEPMYHDAGMFYFCKVKEMLQNKTDVGKKVVGFELSEQIVQDIDTINDWEFASLKYKIMKHVEKELA